MTEVAHTEEMPRVVLTRRRLILIGLFIAVVVAFLYFGLPQLAGLHDTWERIKGGNALWLAGAVLLEACSYLSYTILFRAVMVQGDSRIDWRESLQITMAALLATRLFNAAGAGGVALTAWALRRSGMEPRTVASRMAAFMALLYSVYMGVLVIGGVGLYVGLFPGGGSFAITVLPAIVGATAIAVFLAFAALPQDFERRFAGWSQGRGRLARAGRGLATVPASVGAGVRTAIVIVRRRDPQVLGAVGWWGFDIAVLWACFHAFGAAPAVVVVIMAYFVGTFGNLLPLPGGVGGVEGGMIGAFAAFGQSVDVAIVAVLSYRAISFWLPTVPGALAYLRLRRTVRDWRQTAVTPSYTK